MTRQHREREGLIDDLRNHFRLVDNEKSLLSFIDQSILHNHIREENSGIESTFLITLETLSKIHGLRTPALCYLFMGNNFTLLHGRRVPAAPLEIPNVPASLRVFADRGNDNFVEPQLISRQHKHKELFKYFADANTILISPIYSPSGTLLCLIILTDAEAHTNSRLAEKEPQQFVAAVTSQLSIAYSHFLNDWQKSKLADLWDIFLMSDLSPSKCFGNLATMIPSCLPSFGPLKLQKSPEVQILILDRSQTGTPTHLTIRATTGEEPDTTRIGIHNSICGLLVEKSAGELPYFCDNPARRKYGNRYKNYLGVGKKRSIETELAVRLLDKEEFVGVLNLETEVKNAYSIHHIEAVQNLAQQVAPMIAVFEDRLMQNKMTQYSLGATTARYLDSLASIFKHGIRTPILNLRTDLDFIEASVNQDLPARIEKIASKSNPAAPAKEIHSLRTILFETSEAVKRLNSVRTQINEFADEFASNISGFGQLGRINLCEMLREVVNLTRNSLLQKIPQAIHVKWACKKEMYAFCSPLLKQYIFCLLHNSILSIQQRMNFDPQPGKILLSVFEDTSPRNSQEKLLNERWIIRIQDNGMGVKEDQLTKLCEFNFGTRFRSDTGSGYGLFATQRYITSVGGRIELNSVQEKYFEVLLYLDKYREELHGPLSLENV